jgi:hypothetical protein
MLAYKMSKMEEIEVLDDTTKVEMLENLDGVIKIVKVHAGLGSLGLEVEGGESVSVVLPFRKEAVQKINRQSLKRFMDGYLLRKDSESIGRMASKWLSYKIAMYENFFTEYKENGYVKILNGVYQKILPMLANELMLSKEMTEWDTLHISPNMEFCQMMEIDSKRILEDCDCPMWHYFINGLKMHLFPNKVFFNLNMVRFKEKQNKSLKSGWHLDIRNVTCTFSRLDESPIAIYFSVDEKLPAVLDIWLEEKQMGRPRTNFNPIRLKSGDVLFFDPTVIKHRTVNVEDIREYGVRVNLMLTGSKELADLD